MSVAKLETLLWPGWSAPYFWFFVQRRSQKCARDDRRLSPCILILPLGNNKELSWNLIFGTFEVCLRFTFSWNRTDIQCRGRSQWPRRLRLSLRPLAYCDHGFESHRGYGCSSVVCVACCQVEVSATSWSLVQRSPTDCGASLCVITKPRGTRTP
jgi:hypothetical protein